MRSSILSPAIVIFALPSFTQQPGRSATPQTPTATAKAGPEGQAAIQKRADIRKMMEIMGAKETISRLVNGVMQSEIESAEKMRPDIPRQFWEEFQQRVALDLHPEELMDALIPVYEKHFSDDDIKQIIAFYETPAGKRYIESLSQVQAESMDVGRAWGEQLGKRIGATVEDEMRAKGYKSGEPPKPPSQ